MIAEDEAIIRLDLKELLEEEGYEVVGETGRGDEAIDLVRELAARPRHPRHQDARASTVSSAARQIAGERLAAVLILTAFSQRDLVEQARDAGALAYLVKPFQKSDLIPAIEIALGRYAELAALEREVGDLAGAARGAEDDRPGQGPADGRARHDRAGGLAVPPAAGDGEPGEGRRDRATGRRRHAHTLKPSYAGPTIETMAKTTDVAPKLLLLDGHLARVPRLLRAPHRPRHPQRARSRTRSTGSRRCWSRCSPTSTPTRSWSCSTRRAERSATTSTTTYKAGRKETPDLFVPQIPLIHEVIDALRIPTLRDRRRGSRRRDRHARDAAPPPSASTWSSSPATATRTSSCEDPHIKVLYNRRGVSDYVLYDEAGIVERSRRHRRRSTPSTRRCAATRATTCRASPGSARRRRRSSSPPTATSRGSSSTSTSCRPSSARTSVSARDRVFLNRQMSLLRARRAARRRSR